MAPIKIPTRSSSPPPPPTADPLIPGLPDEIAEQCLLRLSFPHQFLACSVSSAWNSAISSAAFRRAKLEISPAIPSPQQLFVFAFDRISLSLQWQALDPMSRRWFVLPPMPLPDTPPLCSPAFASAAVAGEIYVLGGMRFDAHAPLATVSAYSSAVNTWRSCAPMPAPRAFFTAESVGGRIFAAGGVDGEISAGVDGYDPAEDRWSPVASMRSGMARYDAAAVGRRLYVTEGWAWPFSFAPRGRVYDADRDTWEEMAEGMVEGWTGSSAVVGGRIFTVSDCGGKVKAYDSVKDTWRAVSGEGVPAILKRPYAVAGGEGGRIYVVASGLDVGLGTVVEAAAEGWWRVDWEVVKAPPAFAGLDPNSAHVLHV